METKFSIVKKGPSIIRILIPPIHGKSGRFEVFLFVFTLAIQEMYFISQCLIAHLSKVRVFLINTYSFDKLLI